MKSAGGVLFLSLLLWGLSSCADLPDVGDSDLGEAGFALGTSFQASGLATEDALVRVDLMRFPNARLTLEHDSGAVLESDTFELEFAPSDGVARVSGPDLALPEPGTWRVFFEVLPEEPADKGPGTTNTSLSVQGLWFFGETATEPSPLPWHESRDRRDVRAATSFRYLSDSEALVEIGSVVVHAESETLGFDLDFAAWRSAVLEPAVAALFDELERDEADPAPASGASGEWREREDRTLRDTVRDVDGIGLMNLLERVSARAEGPAR